MEFFENVFCKMLSLITKEEHYYNTVKIMFDFNKKKPSHNY